MKINIIYLIIQGERRNINVLRQGGGNSSSAVTATLIRLQKEKGR